MSVLSFVFCLAMHDDCDIREGGQVAFLIDDVGRRTDMYSVVYRSAKRKTGENLSLRQQQ